jgi:hypothetical protein
MPGQHDVIVIDDIETTHFFYGKLDDFPHTYRITVNESTTVSLQILVPDSHEVAKDKTGLLLEVLPNDAGVREVKRLPAKEATWDSEFAWRTGDSYLIGPSYFDTIEPGTYHFEISTPINKGPYVLAVGTRVEFSLGGYFDLVSDIAHVKEFFGKSKFWAIQSPFVFVPLLMLMLIVAVIYRVYSRRFT